MTEKRDIAKETDDAVAGMRSRTKEMEEVASRYTSSRSEDAEINRELRDVEREQTSVDDDPM